MSKKLEIDSKTARMLWDLREVNGTSWKELYASFIGSGDPNEVSETEVNTFQRNITRKVQKEMTVGEILEAAVEPTNLVQDRNIAYEIEDGEISVASGVVYLSEFDENDQRRSLIDDSQKLIARLYREYNLDEKKYELVKYNPSIINGKFKVQARFEKRKPTPKDEEEVIARYTRILSQLGSVAPTPTMAVEDGNALVINFCDIHYNKMPYIGFSDHYLKDFERDIYTKLSDILDHASRYPIAKVVFTIGHDFFQYNDSKGKTKHDTPVSHIMEYEDMFESGLRILANCIFMINQKYPMECYYVNANHDSTAAWHATRELSLMFASAPDIAFATDKSHHHYLEWGDVLVEIIHENIKGGRGRSVMAYTAREAWGRTKYHYSIGGHLHGEYTTKERDGTVIFGSRALSDADEWHYLKDYVTNIRGIQAYLFNKHQGHIATFNANL